MGTDALPGAFFVSLSVWEALDTGTGFKKGEEIFFAKEFAGDDALLTWSPTNRGKFCFVGPFDIALGLKMLIPLLGVGDRTGCWNCLAYAAAFGTPVFSSRSSGFCVSASRFGVSSSADVFG